VLVTIFITRDQMPMSPFPDIGSSDRTSHWLWSLTLVRLVYYKRSDLAD